LVSLNILPSIDYSLELSFCCFILNPNYVKLILLTASLLTEDATSISVGLSEPVT